MVKSSIKHKKNEINNLEKSLERLDNHYAYLEQEQKDIGIMQQEINKYDALIHDSEIELEAMLSSSEQDKKVIIEKSGQFYNMTEEFNKLKKSLELREQQYNNGVARYSRKKNKLNSQLAQLKQQAVELDNSLNNKKDCIDRNVKNINALHKKSKEKNLKNLRKSL